MRVAPRIVLITDPAFGDDAILRCVTACARALPKGALGVQLRDKRRALPSLRVFASSLRALTDRLGAWLVVNGDARLARDVGADGVHLGGGVGSVGAARRAVGRATWVSVAAHSDEEARRAAADGADAILVSPVFSTRTPSPLTTVALAPAKAPRGLEAIRSARNVTGGRVKLYALGGVTSGRAAICAAAGADGVAVIRALLASDNPAAASRAIHDAFAWHW